MFTFAFTKTKQPFKDTIRVKRLIPYPRILTCIKLAHGNTVKKNKSLHCM